MSQDFNNGDDLFNQGYYQPNVDNYQQPSNTGYYQSSSDMTVKDWLLTYLLCCIPIANIVLMFMWAFGNKAKPSKKTWARAGLILCLIVLVIEVLMFVALIGLGLGAVTYSVSY